MHDSVTTSTGNSSLQNGSKNVDKNEFIKMYEIQKKILTLKLSMQ